MYNVFKKNLDVEYAKQFHSITSNARCKWSGVRPQNPRTERICTFVPGRHVFLKMLMHISKQSHLTRMPRELNCRRKCVLNHEHVFVLQGATIQYSPFNIHHSITRCRSKRAPVRSHVLRVESSGASVTQQCIPVCLGSPKQFL